MDQESGRRLQLLFAGSSRPATPQSRQRHDLLDSLKCARAALLKGLAAASYVLGVVTTRYSLPDLKAFWQTTAPEVKLLRLSRDAGGRRESPRLTLTLLGGFLKRAFQGDIRLRDRVKFEKAELTHTRSASPSRRNKHSERNRIEHQGTKIGPGTTR